VIKMAGARPNHNIKEGGTLTDDLLVHREQTYDHRNRPEKAYQTLSRGTTTGDRVQLSDLDYDELGRVEEQNLHATNGGGTTFKQSVDFKYNIRNWLTHVNNGSFDTSESGAESDLFGMELVYDGTVSGFTTTPKYNGGISALRWKVDD